MRSRAYCYQLKRSLLKGINNGQYFFATVQYSKNPFLLI
jgi:hypothetical protein